MTTTTLSSPPIDRVELAISKGSKLILPPDHPIQLAGSLERAAQLYPKNEIFYLLSGGQVEKQTYPELLQDAACILSGLRERGFRPGQPVVFQLEHNRDFLGTFWACALGGYIPVPVSISPTYEQPHSILAKLRNAWTMLKGPPVVAGAALSARLSAWGQLERLEGFRVESIDLLRQSPPAKTWHRAAPDDVALLLLTSGSTGRPKAVRQTHRHLLSWGASVAQACEFDHRDVSINWMPLDHVGGLVMFHLRDVITGCSQGHAATDLVLQQPLVWLDWIERYGATITWAPNFAFGLVNEQADEIARRRWDLSSMRFILNGGEAIISRTARRFLELLSPHRLPATAMRPAWGMSETCSGVTYSRRFTLAATRDTDLFVEVGEPIPGIQLRIVDEDDAVVPEGKIGHLQIRGISVTDGYHDNPEANENAFTTDGWYITGDLGMLNGGRLTITGREKDVIIINGANFYSHEIESLVEEIEGVDVSYTAACAIRPNGENTDRLAVFFCPLPTAGRPTVELVRAIRSVVAKKGGVTPDFVIPLSREEVPKTAIGKIQRSLLRERFESGAYTDRLMTAEPGQDMVLFAPGWKETSPLEPASWSKPGRCLILADDAGLGQKLAERLLRAGHTCLVVTARGGPVPSLPGGHHLQINPQDPAEFARIFSEFKGPRAFTHAVHAWSYAPDAMTYEHRAELEAEQQRGSLSLIKLLQAWPEPEEASPRIPLIIAVTHVYLIRDTDEINFARAPLCGIARTVSQEYAWLDCRLVDLEGRDRTNDALLLERELATTQSESEIAIRNDLRLTSVLRPMTPVSTASPIFNFGGLYAISGGLGGVGQQVARHLAQRYRAKLLLLGQTPLPDRTQWEVCLQQNTTVARRIRAWLELEAAGGEVRYVAGDVADPDFVQGALDGAVRNWGEPLAGVLHLAGSYHEAPLATESEESFWRVVRPKLIGGWALQRAARHHGNCLFVHFSSVLSFFSSFGTGSYAGANAALDALAHAQRKQGLRSYSLLWSLWNETGMASGFEAKDAMRVRGYLALDPAQGLDLFERALQTDCAQVVIGLDGQNRALQKRLDCSTLSTDASGEFVAPRTPVELTLARLWSEILGVSPVGLKDNFFELGGRSLLAARLFARIEKEWGQKLPLATLYQAPTLEALAALLGEPTRSQPSCRLLAIQAKGTRPPFFCIPGGGSDVIVFQDLAEALGHDQPLYGLQARGLDATPIEGDFPSVEEVAADFIRAIKTVQPEGPYFIGGHCFGCLLAWEVSRQLIQSGERVGHLALLDPIVSNVFSGEIIGRDRLRYHLAKFWKMSWSGKANYFAEKVRNFSRTLVVRQRIGHSYAQAESMHRRYQLGPYRGNVSVALAMDSFFKLSPDRDPRRYYEKITHGTVDYFEVRGDHHGILHAPGVHELAAGLNERLEKISRSNFVGRAGYPSS